MVTPKIGTLLTDNRRTPYTTNRVLFPSAEKHRAVAHVMGRTVRLELARSLLGVGETFSASQAGSALKQTKDREARYANFDDRSRIPARRRGGRRLSRRFGRIRLVAASRPRPVSPKWVGHFFMTSQPTHQGCNGTLPTSTASSYLDGGGSGVGAGQWAWALSPSPHVARPQGRGGEYCGAAASVNSHRDGHLESQDGSIPGRNRRCGHRGEPDQQLLQLRRHEFGATAGFQAVNDGLRARQSPARAAHGTTYTFGDTSGTIYSGQPRSTRWRALLRADPRRHLQLRRASVRKSLIRNWNNLFSGAASPARTTARTAFTTPGAAATSRAQRMPSSAFSTPRTVPRRTARAYGGRHRNTGRTVPAGASQSRTRSATRSTQTVPTIANHAGRVRRLLGQRSGSHELRPAPETAVPPPLDSSGNPTLSTDTTSARRSKTSRPRRTSPVTSASSSRSRFPTRPPRTLRTWYPTVLHRRLHPGPGRQANKPPGFLCPNGLPSRTRTVLHAVRGRARTA